MGDYVDPDDALTTCAQVRKLRQGALPYWRPLYEARVQERDFIDGDRYEEDNGLYNRDRRRQQFRGQETTNVNRHKVAKATTAPRQIEALPVDQSAHADDAETAVSILEWELAHPQKGFDDVVEEVLQDAVDCRAGAAVLDYDPDMGPYGETYWRYKDVNLLMWEPGFADPHHMKCGWFQEVRRMLISDIQAMGELKGKARWQHTDDVRPDAQVTLPSRGLISPDGIPRQSSTSAFLGVPGISVDDKHAWVLFCWYKNDPATYNRVGEETLIPESDRYLACDNPQCTYREMTQGELQDSGAMDKGDELPEQGPPCPMCGYPTSRRDVNATQETVLAYPRGRRLVVMPLLQYLADDEPFYDGAWPVPAARSFPLLYITAYVKPGRPMGDSDTTRNWEGQIAKDQLLTMMFDRITRHQNYYVLPQVGIYDYRGQRFEFRDDQFNVMFRDMSNGSIPTPMPEMFAGSSLDPEWANAYNVINQDLLGHQGITDLGITPSNSKDIPVGTVAQLNQMGEIPVEHFIRRKNRALGKAYGVHWDYIRSTYGPKRLARLSINGEPIVARLRGDDLPNFDFIVSETPEFSGLDKDKNEAFKGLISVAQTTPQYLDLFAKINRYPPSIVREFKKVQQQQAQQAAAAQQSPGALSSTPSPAPAAAPPPSPAAQAA